MVVASLQDGHLGFHIFHKLIPTTGVTPPPPPIPFRSCVSGFTIVTIIVELNVALLKTKKGDARGQGGIHVEMLQILNDIGKLWLLKLINLSLDKGRLPNMET